MKTNQRFFLTLAATLVTFANAYAGRWLSRDPIEEGAGFIQRDPTPEMKFLAPRQRNDPNLYVFVRNHPPIAYDALGLQCCLTTISPGTFTKPDGTPDSSLFGHSILNCDNGAYVSLWPQPEGWENKKWDDDTYQNATKNTICFPCLDEKKVQAWIDANKGTTVWTPTFSCADAVLAAMLAGLSDQSKPNCPCVGGTYMYPRNVLEETGSGTTPAFTLPSDAQRRLQALIDNNCNKWKCVKRNIGKL